MSYPDHYSFSQMNEHCGKKLWFKYLDPRRIKPPPTGAMCFGNVFEHGVNESIEYHFFRSRKSLCVGTEIIEKIHSYKNTLSAKEFEDLKSKQERIVMMVHHYMSQIDYEPLYLQRKINLNIDGLKRPLTGFIDIIGKRGDQLVVIDIKTKEKKPSVPQYGWIQQLCIYAIWTQLELNLDRLPSTENHLMVSRKKDYEFVKFDNWITAKDVSEVITGAKDLETRVENNYFPLNRSHMLCNPKWCGFYETCHNDFNVSESESFSCFSV